MVLNPGSTSTRALAQAIVDTVREPLLVLDGDLRVLAVSRSFYLTFQVNRQDASICVTRINALWH
ncbi:MAG TPA: hypothetical protein VGQ88_06325 [Burkholderiales bacterium]|nr:hypothetical protein [Burkholderiales bacterium]